MSEGQVVYAKPDLTGLKEKVAGKIIKIRQNPFLGTEIAPSGACGKCDRMYLYSGRTSGKW